jgi:hypothetical protein
VLTGDAGFDGQLTAKANMLRACPLLAACLGSKSDVRGLAYVAATASYSCGSLLYAAGQPCRPGTVSIIQEGACRVRGGCSRQVASSAWLHAHH